MIEGSSFLSFGFTELSTTLEIWDIFMLSTPLHIASTKKL